MRADSGTAFWTRAWRTQWRTSDCLGLICFTLLLALGRIQSAQADGCFVFKWNKAIDINEPTQKAIIVHDAGREDLLLQVKYEGPLEEFGWLIPVPSLPKVEKGSMEPFYELSQLTQRQFGGAGRKGFATLGAASADAEKVKVIEIKTVGAYEVAILSADDSGALARWLNAHDYSLPEGESEIIDDYIRRGWCFIAAKIELNKGSAFKTASTTAPTDAGASAKTRATVQKRLSSGELHPLLISFDTPKCIFPLRISALNGKPSEASLYVLSREPLLEKSTFDQACAKLDRGYAEWVEQTPQRIRSRQEMMENTHRIRLAAMMRGPYSPGGSSEESSRTQSWSAEDLDALAREMTWPAPDQALGETFYASPGELLHEMRVASGKIPACAKALPRLKGQLWHLTKLAQTFAPAEMQDLEFEPAIPALMRLVPDSIGGIATHLLAKMSDDALPVLLKACETATSTERLNVLCGFDRAQEPVPTDVLLDLMKDDSPRVRLHAARCADANWDERLADPLIGLLRDPYFEVRQEATGPLSNHEPTNRTPVYLTLLKDPDPHVRAHSLAVVSWMNRYAASEEVFREALRLLNDPNEDVQGAAVTVLLKSRQPVPISDLLPLLNHPNPDTVAFVANLLRGGGRIRYVGESAESTPPVFSADLAPLMTNRFGNVRLIGLRAMQNIADATAVELTLPLLRDTNSVIRNRAFFTLQAITGDNISENDAAKWEAWWTANKPAFKPEVKP